jgi:serine/threonine-protein kinase
VGSNEVDLEVLKPGAIFQERYEIVRCLKAGGMGAVYEVVDQGTRRRRALKTMLSAFVSDPDMRARFHLEATVAADVESEHIVEIFDAGVDDATGLPFLVMELLKGETLAEALARRGRIAANDVVVLLHQASLALDRTHAAGIVHRDLKPENLFLTRRDDGSLRLKLLDFGIAKVVAQSSHASTTRSFGTPLYMSPEQIRGDGDIGPRADTYALGQLAFSLLTGKPYWEPEAQQATGVYGLLLKVMQGAPETGCARAERFGTRLPERFNEWFHTATALEAGDRFDTASELVETLATALDVPLPRSLRSASLDTFTGHAAVVGTAPTVSSPVVLQARADAGGNDSTGAVSSGERLAARAVRRDRLVWGALILAVVAALVVVTRNAVLTPSSPEPRASPATSPSPSSAGPDMPVLPPSASAAPTEAPPPRAATSQEIATPMASAIPTVPLPRRRAPAATRPKPTGDPSDIR